MCFVAARGWLTIGGWLSAGNGSANHEVQLTSGSACVRRQLTGRVNHGGGDHGSGFTFFGRLMHLWASHQLWISTVFAPMQSPTAFPCSTNRWSSPVWFRMEFNLRLVSCGDVRQPLVMKGSKQACRQRLESKQLFARPVTFALLSWKVKKGRTC